MNRDRWILIMLTVAANIAVFAGAPTFIRLITVLPFLAIAPGMAIIRLARTLGFRGEMPFVLVVALSIALETLVAQAFLYTSWSPAGVLAVLTLLTLVGAALPSSRRHPAGQLTTTPTNATVLALRAPVPEIDGAGVLTTAPMKGPRSVAEDQDDGAPASDPWGL